MLDAHQPSARVDDHTDRVEPHDRRERAVRALGQPASGHAPDLRPLAGMERVERLRPPDPSGLHLAKRQNAPPVERDDVKLAPARAVVALDDLVPQADEVLRGELFAEPAEVLTSVVAHGG